VRCEMRDESRCTAPTRRCRFASRSQEIRFGVPLPVDERCLLGAFIPVLRLLRSPSLNRELCFLYFNIFFHPFFFFSRSCATIVAYPTFFCGLWIFSVYKNVLNILKF
jgi:hypothetical protein